MEWQELSARMIDAQSRGLANRVIRLAQLFEQNDWQEQVLHYLGELFLLTEAFRQYDQLPCALQDELLSQAGVGFRKKELMEKSGLVDRWEVWGRKISREDRMEVQRTWLYSRSHRRYALLLEFAFGRGGSFETNLEVGSSFLAEMIFYPGAYPTRAWFREKPSYRQAIPLPYQYPEIPAMLHDYASALNQNPFIGQFPVLIDQLIPQKSAQGLWVKDPHHNVLPLPHSYSKFWTLMAVSGGRPVPIFGEWNGQYFLPLGIWDETRWTNI